MKFRVCLVGEATAVSVPRAINTEYLSRVRSRGSLYPEIIEEILAPVGCVIAGDIRIFEISISVGKLPVRRQLPFMAVRAYRVLDADGIIRNTVCTVLLKVCRSRKMRVYLRDAPT